jgi:phenylacetate-coenzyme A ligase PaaK-like adenylate-forming protein
MTTDLAQERRQRLESLIAHQGWSREQLLEHQQAGLRALVRYAVDRSPYYRETLGTAVRDGDVRLEELPTLPKSTLMNEWDRVVTDRRLDLAGAERHLAGDTSDLYLDEYRVLATGGSTGKRGVFVYGREEFEVSLAGMLRAVSLAGIGPQTRFASIGSPSPAHLTSHVFAMFRAGRTGSPRLMVTTPLDEIVEGLNEYRPEAIATYPTILRLLAEARLEGRLRIEPRILVTSSEVLSAETVQRAYDAWGIPVRNAYASTEAGMMATDSAELCGLHVWEDTLILEVVDEHTRPVPPGVPGFRVLVTNLWNRVQPLIRYELADSVTLAEGENPTGRPFARIARIDGRSDDILQLPARDGGTVAVHPIHLREPFTRLPDVRQYQFCLRGDTLSVRVALSATAERDVPDRIRGAVERALLEAGADVPRLEIVRVEEIPRVGSGAKLTFVESSARSREPAFAR